MTPEGASQNDSTCGGNHSSKDHPMLSREYARYLSRIDGIRPALFSREFPDLEELATTPEASPYDLKALSLVRDLVPRNENYREPISRTEFITAVHRKREDGDIRPVLSALTQLIRERSLPVGELDNPNRRSELSVQEQMLGAVRRECHSPLLKHSKLIWDGMKPILDKEELLVPSYTNVLAPDGLPTSTSNGVHFTHVPIGADFRHQFPAETLSQGFAAFKVMLGAYCAHSSQQWGNEQKGSEDYESMHSMLKMYFQMPPEHAFMKGFCSGINIAIGTLESLLKHVAQEKEPKSLTQPLLADMTELHQDFVFALSKINLPAFQVLLQEFLTVRNPETLDWMEKYYKNPALAELGVVDQCSTTMMEFKSNFLSFSCVEGSNTPEVPIADINEDAITERILLKLNSSVPTVGCSASLILPEFVPWALSAAQQSCGSPHMLQNLRV